jgi:hypothetical protein
MINGVCVTLRGGGRFGEEGLAEEYPGFGRRERSLYGEGKKGAWGMVAGDIWQKISTILQNDTTSREVAPGR